ncbi:echinoidin-like [Patiria miniata]|uniref:C-type lectin domain-containing protein n=1 Tax=Patiria miniata TaxID=46514 RepID=A0A913ZWL5_PATMI|nr:echinoidin-like [Patiria miniata]
MRIKGTLLVIFSLDIVGSSFAIVCYAGRGFDVAVNSLQWGLPVADPCRCTAVRLGGEITTAAPAFSPLSRGGDLLLSEDAEEIWSFFNCTARFCATLPGSEHWQSFGLSCYLIINLRFAYLEAEKYCGNLATQGKSTHLASVHSAEENAFLRRYHAAVFQSTSNIALWIGYDRLASGDTYRWLDGSVGSGFEDWKPPMEPSRGAEKCTVLWYGNHWNDWPCYNTAPFVCKMPAY